MRAMIEQDVGTKLNQQKTIRDQGESTIKALKIVIGEQHKEIEHLVQSLDRISKERDFAQGKALINEEITYAAEKSEKKLIAELEQNVQELNNTIAKQANKIQQMEKIVDHREDLTGTMVKYRDVIHPNTATILLHDEMETLHSLIVRLQLQLNYFKGIQLRLVSLVHNILTNLQTKIQGELVDLEEDHEKGQNEFLKILELIQSCKLPNIDSQIKHQNSHSPMNTEMIGSPMPSPFPAKAPQINKNFQNLNQTYDNFQIDDAKKQVVPKLNLSKAFQIQQINAKRSTQQMKMSEDQLQNKIKKLETEIEENKKNLQREMLLCKHFEIENESMRRYIKQIEGNNDILVKSNMNLNQKWQKIQKSFLFYKTFFVEHKDQYSQLQQIVQSEKEATSYDEVSDLNFNSARLHSKKETTIRKRPMLDQTSIVHSNMIFQDTSLMEVEKILNRGNQSYSQNIDNRLHSESIVDQSAMDYDLGHACMERGDESDESVKDREWKDNCKKEWTFLATQVHQFRQKEMVQQIKPSIATQKLTNIKL